MRRILPSIRALESFEAVARCGNVTRAAEELGRTQSAVSRQVANLEEFVRRELFIRDRKHLVLNETGQRYLEKVVRLLDELEAESARITTPAAEERVLRLGVLPTFGSRWLMPRLSDFAQRDSCELHLVKGLGRLDFARENVDAAIECTNGEPADLIAHHLLDETVVAVISPELFERKEVTRHELLHMPARPDAWRLWAQERKSSFTRSSLTFENYSMMIEAVCLGFGVAVLPTIYVTREISSGQLVTPFGEPLASGRSYWLTYPEQSRRKKKVVEFTEWLLMHRQTAAAQTRT